MFVISTEQHCRTVGWIEKRFKKKLNSHVDDNPQDETNQLILCVFLEHKLNLRAHEHLPNALPLLHNRYRVSQLLPSALF